MDRRSDTDLTAMQILENMFDVEMSYLSSHTKDVESLTSAFHSDVVVHEPASLPYAGDWQGLEGIGRLLQKMSDTFSNVSVDSLECAQAGDAIFMTCTLRLTCRASGRTVEQPFAEVLRFENRLLIEGTPFYYDTAEVLSAIQDGNLLTV
jgi:ketosteroid isomerase-like protein